MKTIYHQRLLKFAAHLAKVKNPKQALFQNTVLIDLDFKVHTSYNAVFACWVFEELPQVFGEWCLTEEYGHPFFLSDDEDGGTIGAVIDWFGLDILGFMHIFDMEEFQDVSEYGGRLLTTKSTGVDIAFNIKEMVRRATEPGYFP